MSKLSRDFRNDGVDCDYDSISNCEEVGCDYICRCSTIKNVRISYVDVTHIASEIYNEFFDKSLSNKRDCKINSIFGISKEIDIYTIDRILRYYRIWDYESWFVDVCSGYYGEEISSICFKDNISIKIEDKIETALLIDDLSKRIEFLLKLEYGYLLPELKGCSFEIDTVLKDDIVFGSINQYRKVSTENLEHYSDNKYLGIRGVVIEDDNKIKIIDGYHRIFKTSLNKVMVIKAKKNG